ncbi:hypothetical protein NPIL_472171, partial [Nephila pilipes]
SDQSPGIDSTSRTKGLASNLPEDQCGHVQRHTKGHSQSWDIQPRCRYATTESSSSFTSSKEYSFTLESK